LNLQDGNVFFLSSNINKLNSQRFVSVEMIKNKKNKKAIIATHTRTTCIKILLIIIHLNIQWLFYNNFKLDLNVVN
jgi:hypothetical protein